MRMPARFAVSFLALVVLLGLGLDTAWADPDGLKDVRLMSPEEGDVFHVGDEIVVEGKSRGNPSPEAHVTVFVYLADRRLVGRMTPTKNKWSLNIFLPVHSNYAVVQVICNDPAKGIFTVFERTISILP